MDQNVTPTPPQALIARYKQVTGIVTDYAVAKSLDVSQQAVVAWNDGGGMTPDVALKIAEKIGIPPMQAIAAVRMHSAKRPSERALWEKYCARVLVAALVALGAGHIEIRDAHHTATALEMPSQFDNLYIMRRRIRRFIAAIQTAFRSQRVQWLRPGDRHALQV